MKKKIQNLLIVSLIAVLLTGTASAAFSDVGAGSWYSDAVNYVNDAGIMVGDDKGNFNPDKPVTRAEMAVVICRTLEKTLDEEDYLPIYVAAENFSDVPESHWANMYINKVSFLEIVKGYGNGRFGPSDNVTYEQAITMVIRMLKAEDDAENQGGYPGGFLKVAENMGLLAGVRAAKGEKMSRANVAVLLSNYCRMTLTENPPANQNSSDIPGDVIENTAPGDGSGTLIENIPSQDNQNNQTGNSLEIGGSPQEGQLENGPKDEGNGGGT